VAFSERAATQSPRRMFLGRNSTSRPSGQSMARCSSFDDLPAARLPEPAVRAGWLPFALLPSGTGSLQLKSSRWQIAFQPEAAFPPALTAARTVAMR
jgi:hypothetical protein